MTYKQLVKAVQRGERPTVEDIRLTLAASGKTADDLLADAYADPPPRAGDPCPKCGARLRITHTRRRAGAKIQYLGCRDCAFRPIRNKLIIPTADATP